MKLKIDGLKAKLENEYITISFNNLAKAESLKFCGRELLNNLTGEVGDPDRNNSFYCDYHINGKTINIKPTKLKIISLIVESN